METTTTNSLQKLIEEKASKRLYKDLIALSDAINRNQLLAVSYDASMPKIMCEGKEQTIQQLFYVNGKKITGTYLIALQNLWLPTYIRIETESFVQKVDSLQDQLDDLKSGNNEEFE